MRTSHILFAEPDPRVRTELDEACRRGSGAARVVGVGSAEDALHLLQSRSFDVLVCEKNLPDLDCERFLPRVRQLDPDLPVLVLESREDAAFRDRARAWGPTQVRLRPKDAEGLREMLDRVLETARLADATSKHAARAQRLAADIRGLGQEARRLVRQGRETIGPRRRAADWLPEDPEFARALYDAPGGLVVVLDAADRIVLFNAACQALTGRPAEDARGKDAGALLFVAEEAAAAKDALSRLARAGGVARLDAQCLTRSGDRRWIRWSWTPLAGPGGRPGWVLGMGVDVTASRRQDRRSNLLDAIVSSSRDAIIALDLHGRILHWNPGAERTFGFDSGDVTGRTLCEIFGSEAPCTVDGIVAKLRRGEALETSETDCPRKDGRRITILCTPSPIVDERGELAGFSMIARDVSDLKRAARRKDVLEHVTRVLGGASTLRAAAPALLAELGRGLHWAVCELWEVDEPADLLRHSGSWHAPDPKLAAFVASSSRLTFAPGVGLAGRVWSERRALRVDDVSREPWVVRGELAVSLGLRACAGVPVLVRGRVAAILSFFTQDAPEDELDLLASLEALGTQIGLVVERNRAVQGRADQESRMRAIVETAADGIITIDENGVIDTFNPAAERLFGYAAAEIIGRDVSVLMPEPDRSAHGGYLARYLRTGEKRIIGKGREVAGRRKDGSTFPLYLSVSEMYSDGRRRFTGIVRDLTELKTMHDEVTRTRGLAAIGEASAAVVHEIKNPLGAISAPLQVLVEGFPAGDPRREVLADVLRQVSRLDRTVRDLLLLAKPWTPRMAEVDLTDLIRRLVSSSGRQELLARVRVVFTRSESAVATCDPSMVEQILWNLLLNAAQAMTDGGEIRIEVLDSDETVEVVVADDGPGIPPHVQAKLFQPFFTTKPAGTGLGLSISRKIMDAHRGELSLSSRPGEGTRVTLVFPRRRSSR